MIRATHYSATGRGVQRKPMARTYRLNLQILEPDHRLKICLLETSYDIQTVAFYHR